VGNTGVTKIGVVERGKLQRHRAREDRKRLPQQALQGAGWGRGWRVITEKRLNHNPRVGGSSPSSATNPINVLVLFRAPSGSAWVSIWVTRHQNATESENPRVTARNFAIGAGPRAPSKAHRAWPADRQCAGRPALRQRRLRRRRLAQSTPADCPPRSEF
jgi:hypothetical protein